jgi:hypothetical protein
MNLIQGEVSSPLFLPHLVRGKSVTEKTLN